MGKKSNNAMAMTCLAKRMDMCAPPMGHPPLAAVKSALKPSWFMYGRWSDQNNA
jgi:hypothetical protein